MSHLPAANHGSHGGAAFGRAVKPEPAEAPYPPGYDDGIEGDHRAHPLSPHYLDSDEAHDCVC